MKKNLKSGLIVLIILIVLVIAFSVVNSIISSKNNVRFLLNRPEITISSINSSKPNKIYSNRKTKNYIAALYLEGTIDEENNSYNQKWIMSTIQALSDDDKNVAIALYINSPGGAVYQADEVYLALQNYRTKGKKIFVYQGSLAASGGYYISCAGNKIYANRNTLTGSIGVIAGQSFDLTGLFNNLGIKSETIHAGKNKNMGNYNEPFTDEQRAIMQSIADECYDQFTSIVATQREIPISKVKKIADGRIYTAKQALELGLIDRIDTWENMIEDLKSEISETKEIDTEQISTKTFKYEHKKTFIESMMYSYSNFQNAEVSSKLGLPQKVLDDINGFNNYPAFIYHQ